MPPRPCTRPATITTMRRTRVSTTPLCGRRADVPFGGSRPRAAGFARPDHANAVADRARKDGVVRLVGQHLAAHRETGEAAGAEAVRKTFQVHHHAAAFEIADGKIGRRVELLAVFGRNGF